MMKTAKSLLILVLFQLLFSCLQAYLVTRISLIGRIGIRFFYKEYRILRSGWKTALLFFCIQVIIILALWFIQKKYNRKTNYAAAGILLLIAIVGLITTYNDFQHTYTHRLLKERFHLGFYLFWIGWITSCVYFMITTHMRKTLWPEDANNSKLKIQNAKTPEVPF